MNNAQPHVLGSEPYKDNRLNTFLFCKFANNVDQTVYWTKLNILHPTKRTALDKSCNDRPMFNA